MGFSISMSTRFSPFIRMSHLFRNASIHSQVVLDPKVDSHENLKALIKQNRNFNKAGQYRIPEDVLMALSLTFDEWRKSRLVRDADDLNKMLASRPIPLDHGAAVPLAAKLENHFASHTEIDNLDSLKDLVRNKIGVRAKQWFSSDTSTRFKAAVYTMARFSTLYSTSLYCLNELRRCDPDFVPNLVLDYGCGPSAVLWSVRKLWSTTKMYYLGIEHSAAMQSLCSDILQAVSEDIAFAAVSFRASLSTISTAKHSLVISNHSLVELASHDARVKCVLSLWRSVAVGGYLILMESGNTAGYQAIIEARRNLLHAKFKDSYGWRTRVVAPCPHHLRCPRITKSKTTCHFQVPYYDLELCEHHDHSAPQGVAKFSYLILQKLESESPMRRTDDWPGARVVQPVLSKKNCVICRMCSSRGRIEEVIATKSNCPEGVYRLFKNIKWGDTIPIRLEDRLAESSTPVDSVTLVPDNSESLFPDNSESLTSQDSESHTR